MAIVLVPYFCGKLVECFTGYVALVCFQALHPNHEFVLFLFRQRQNALLQFG